MSYFKNLVFYLDIILEGESQESAFTSLIIEAGGRIIKNLGASATHLIWSNGKIKSISKASELKI
jgi:hypothetical protein